MWGERLRLLPPFFVSQHPGQFVPEHPAPRAGRSQCLSIRSLHALCAWWATVRLAQVALQSSGYADIFILNTHSFSLCKVLCVGINAKSCPIGDSNA